MQAEGQQLVTRYCAHLTGFGTSLCEGKWNKRIPNWDSLGLSGSWGKESLALVGAVLSCGFVYSGRGAGGTFCYAEPIVLTVPCRLTVHPALSLEVALLLVS